MDLWVSKGEKSQKGDKFIQEVKKGYNTSPVLQDEEIRQYLKYIQTILYIVPIDKASNNFSFVCRKFCETGNNND